MQPHVSRRWHQRPAAQRPSGPVARGCDGEPARSHRARAPFPIVSGPAASERSGRVLMHRGPSQVPAR